MKRKTSDTKTKKEQVVDLMRDIILSGELVPGERLLQEELAEKFEVSATPIREAVQQLVAEGVLIYSPYKGVQVAEIRMEDVREVYLIRAEMEKLATQMAVLNLKISDVRQLRQIQTQIEQQLATQDLTPLRKLNQEFHMLIYAAADMPILYQLIRNLWTRFPWDTLHVLPNRAAASAQEHQRILAAIDQEDADLAAQAMRDHVLLSATALEKYLAENEVH